MTRLLTALGAIALLTTAAYGARRAARHLLRPCEARSGRFACARVAGHKSRHICPPEDDRWGYEFQWEDQVKERYA